MERTSAISRRPEPLAAALRVHDEGEDGVVDEQLGLRPAGVPTLLRLANAKLSRLLGSDGHAR